MSVEPMVLLAVGDALVRLQGPEKALPLLLSQESDSSYEGGLRALAMQRIRLSPALSEIVLRSVANPEKAALRFWAAAAGPGLQGAGVRAFLRSCETDRLEDTKLAASAALEGRYLTWRPL